jgi:hypothetical protein
MRHYPTPLGPENGAPLEPTRSSANSVAFIRGASSCIPRSTSRHDNTSWQKARRRANLPQVRVHDLKHTFGRRLRAAGVSFEDRQDLLGHKSARMTTHYSAPELSNLIEVAEKACRGSRKSPVVFAPKQKAVWRTGLQPLDVYRRIWRARHDLNPRPPGS